MKETLKNKLPKPYKLKDVLGKFEFYPEVIDGIVTKPDISARPLTVGYSIYGLRSFFNAMTTKSFAVEKNSTKKIGVDPQIKHSSKVNEIVEKIPIQLINEVYNIFTHDLFDKSRRDAFIIDKENMTRESADLVDFLLKVDYGKFPGTPMQKAVMISFIITKNAVCKADEGEEGQGKSQRQKDEEKSESENESSKDGEKIDLVDRLGFSHANTDSMAEDMEIIEKIKPNSFIEKTLDLNEYNPATNLNAIMDNETKDILNVENTIDSIQQWSIKNKKKIRLNIKSKKKKTMPLTTLGQLPKVAIREHLHPMFNYKLISKQLKYKDRYVVDDEKQLSIVLIDDSGSMSSQLKIAWRNAVLHNRLQAVDDGRSDLLLFFYETDIHREYIVNEESSIKPTALYNKLSKHNPCGGGTNIQYALTLSMKKAEDYIKKHKQITHELPVNIIIVCDGQDTFDYSSGMEARNKVCKETNMNFIVNGVIIQTKHYDLKRFCEDTGGKFIYQ